MRTERMRMVIALAVVAAMGVMLAGTPAQVRDEIICQCEKSGINYFVCRFAFGDLTFEESSRSIELFAEHVMPEVSSIS